MNSLGALALAALVAAPAPAAPTATLPEPTGPHPVGITELHLVDHTRQDPWVPGAVRELVVDIRYPSSRTGEPARFTPPPVAEVVAAEDAAVVGVDPGELDYTFPTHSSAGTPAIGRHPVVLYSPGRGVSRAFGTALAEQLASRGYVVVSLDHTHEAPAVAFPDGRVARRALPPSSVEVSKRIMATRVQDTRFVLDQLEVLAGGGNPDAARRALPRGLGLALDLSEVGMFGHSGGGFTAGETMVSDRRIDAGADLDGSMGYSQSDRDFGRVADEGLDRPFLFMSAGDHSAASDASWQEFLRNHRGWSRQLHIPAGEHFTYTDHQALLPGLVARLGLDPAVVHPIIGTVDPVRALAAQRAYLTAFFDQHLRHKPQRLLDGPSAAHPDVRFLG
ncbi:putative dienelactone hydrolase [Saccharothrix coeruleofusca]|uniref:alpha/beta hydrolase family protein n=1 Tax=Saccharothrix coeruleofusca TaxID=33919 RepID=UPI001AE56FE1|nr:lipase [Saccharothrix coeruleofusca]MBP2340634.1 putative dienelactone hydrolase [Saccharothrix coeruleofusca]